MPLFIVGLGDDKPVRDLKLTDLLVDDVVFVDDVVNFEVKLTGTGFAGPQGRASCSARRTSPRCWPRPRSPSRPDGQPQPVRLPYRPTEVGEFRYVVEVEPLEGELQTDNNRQERTVHVRKEQIRVLLVQAYPNYEFRYLRNMLERDETIELNTVLQDADPEHAEQDAAGAAGVSGPPRRAVRATT